MVLAWRLRVRPGTHHDRPLDRRLAIAIFAASALGFLVLRSVVFSMSFHDLRIYRLEGLAVQHGWDLYGHLPGMRDVATYPPFAALLFTATTSSPVQVLEIGNAVLSVLALAYVCVAACRLAGVATARAVDLGLLFGAFAIWCEPVSATFALGQLNLYLLALVLWDATRAEASRWRGVGIGLATAIKVTPGILIVYLLLTRRFRAALTAIVTLALTLVISAVVTPHATVRYWTHYLFQTNRVGNIDNGLNQSVRGWLARLGASGVGVPLAVGVIAVLGMLVSIWAYRLLGDRFGLLACATTGLLVSPVSWSHHWVWCIPIAILLWFEASVWFVIAVVTFCSYAVRGVPHSNSVRLHFTAWQVAASGTYVLFGLAFLAVVAFRCRRFRLAGTATPTLSRRRRCRRAWPGSGARQ